LRLFADVLLAFVFSRIIFGWPLALVLVAVPRLRPRGLLLVFDVLVPERRKTFWLIGPPTEEKLSWIVAVAAALTCY